MITLRTPIVGLLPARSTITLALATPINPDREAPVVLTAGGGYSVVIKQFTASGVVIENMTNRATPYLLAIVPSVAMVAAHSDWRALWAQLRARVARIKG